MVNINGVTYSGTNETINGYKIIIDGNVVNVAEAKEYHIGIYGENATVKTSSGNVTVNGSVSNNISTQSGRVEVHGYVNGNVSTMSGRVEVGGKVSGNISTMSGSIRHG